LNILIIIHDCGAMEAHRYMPDGAESTCRNADAGPLSTP
jgi:hypothetical protein